MALSSITPVFAADKVKITFMSRDSGDTPMAKVYEDQIAAFMEENPDIEVQNDSVYEESAYNNKLKLHYLQEKHQISFIIRQLRPERMGTEWSSVGSDRFT